MKVLTDWYPGYIEPVHPGLYVVERWDSDDGVLVEWNGHDWAQYIRGGLRWRGLAFDPELIRQYSEVGNEDLFLVRVPR